MNRLLFMNLKKTSAVGRKELENNAEKMRNTFTEFEIYYYIKLLYELTEQDLELLSKLEVKGLYTIKELRQEWFLTQKELTVKIHKYTTLGIFSPNIYKYGYTYCGLDKDYTQTLEEYLVEMIDEEFSMSLQQLYRKSKIPKKMIQDILEDSKNVRKKKDGRYIIC